MSSLIRIILKNSPRETLVSQHNPVQSLKLHLGRTLAAGAVSPDPSRFQLCVHSCSPQSLWVNKCKPYFPSAKKKFHITKVIFVFLFSHAKVLQSLQHSPKKLMRETGFCAGSPRKVYIFLKIKNKNNAGIMDENAEKVWKVFKMEITTQRETAAHRGADK